MFLCGGLLLNHKSHLLSKGNGKSAMQESSRMANVKEEGFSTAQMKIIMKESGEIVNIMAKDNIHCCFHPSAEH